MVGSIWATLFVELSVPVLLCFRRTVYGGLAIGTAFHLFLSQFGGLHGFAAMLFAIYFLFLPRAFTADVAARLARWPPPGVRPGGGRRRNLGGLGGPRTRLRG